MSNFSTSVNGKALAFTDSSVSYDGINYEYTMISDIKHRGGATPAFVFDYNGVSVEIPYNPEDKAIALSYFKKAAATTPPPVSAEEPLTSIDDMDGSNPAEEPESIVPEPSPVEAEPIPQPIREHAESISAGPETMPPVHRSFNDFNSGTPSYGPAEKKIYQKTWFIILLLIIFWPVGLFLMWKYADWKKAVKIVITVLVAVCMIFAFIPSTNNDTSSDTSYETSEDTSDELETEETTTEPTTTEPTTTEPTTQAPKEFDEDDYESISYDNLARNPDDYAWKAITGSGEVIQVIEGDGETQLRVAVNDDYDDIIFLSYNPEILDSRVLEDDHITYYGTSTGTITYESTMGGNITIPSCICDKIVIQ